MWRKMGLGHKGTENSKYKQNAMKNMSKAQRVLSSKTQTKCKEKNNQGIRFLKIQSDNMWRRTQLNHKGIRCYDQG